MQFISSKTPNVGIESLAFKIREQLRLGKKVLWLIPGGSNIPIAVQAMNLIRKDLSTDLLAKLTVAQTDERFGAVGHKDSNWKGMSDYEFNFNGIGQVSVLEGLPLNETVKDYSNRISDAFDRSDIIIGQFGIGADGHIAGMLPHAPAITDSALVFAYDAAPFTRISLTPPMLKRINVAYAFVFGGNKYDALKNLQTKSLSIEEEPCQILKMIPEAYLYSDEL